MKQALTILFTFCAMSIAAQNVWVIHNNQLYLKNGNDSIFYGSHEFLPPLSKIVAAIQASKQVFDGDGSLLTGITPTQIGLGAINNTSDANKPISNATQTALNGKLAIDGNGGSLTGLTAAQVSLGNANNTSDANKPVSSATQTALNLKANLASPTFTGTVSGITPTMVNLGNVNNTSDASKPVSTATQTALDGKQATLVSATNIKTINGATVLGSGDLVVSGSAAFSSITGQPADNANLTTALNLKANLASPTFTGTVVFPAGIIGIPEYGRVTGSNVTTTGQTLVDITGLSKALVANAVYEFEANMSASTSAVTTGTSYGVNYSAAGATVEAQIQGASSTTASKAERINAFNTNTTTFLATSAQSGGIRITGTITTGANAGNLTIMHRKLTSGTSTIFINSFLKIIRIQ